MKLTCMIVDDEPLALDLLTQYVARTDFLKLTHRCKSAIQASEILKEEKVDLIFLDIQMPDLTGLEFSKTIDPHTRIIFTTAFNQYAIEGYKVNALDYLLKPFNYEEFFAAASKAMDWFGFVQAKDSSEKTFIFVRSEYRQMKVMLDEVLYFEGLKDYIKVWITGNPKPIFTLLSLKALEKELPSARFMRIHRSFIIALDKIAQVEKNQVAIGKIRITVARQYKEAFQKYLGSKSIKASS